MQFVVVLVSPAEGVCGQGRPQPSPQGWVYGVPQQEMPAPLTHKIEASPYLFRLPKVRINVLNVNMLNSYASPLFSAWCSIKDIFTEHLV